MELILVRHPQPDVAAGTCYGSSDLPATPAALAAGEAALAPLLSEALLRGHRLYSSPLQRCTALAARLGNFTPDARLAEMHFGAWELRSWSDIPRAEVDAWAADLLDYHPGGGETVREVAARVQSFMDDLRQDAVVVCHAGSMRLMAAIAAGESLVQAAAKPNHIKYCEALRLSWPAKSV
ncbi:histidine phosphatase family protein [Pseudoduganella violaceinigra]|uniref:histidine phosphatase family protein n=1 Tax=Pseudoduganella violaceinigra TaxID=246602 RepID=UPI0003F97292|nr:histidine phosphatase family protein [Pseudoduganella violaceinigra]